MQIHTTTSSYGDATEDIDQCMNTRALRKKTTKKGATAIHPNPETAQLADDLYVAIRDRSNKEYESPETLTIHCVKSGDSQAIPKVMFLGLHCETADLTQEDKVILHKLGSVTVDRQGDIVIKTAAQMRKAQAEILDLLEPLVIPVPRHLCFEQLKGYMTRLRQSYIEGETLDKAWPDMTTEQKKSVTLQLRAIIDTFRKLQPTFQMIQSVDGGPAWWLRGLHAIHEGPFQDEVSFNHLAYEIYDKAPASVKRALKDFMPTGHRVVLAHGDLAQRNIMVKNKETITGLIDWEYAGWFPEYWDHVKSFDNFTEPFDWKELVDIIFSEHYDHELACYQAFRRWQAP